MDQYSGLCNAGPQSKAEQGKYNHEVPQEAVDFINKRNLSE